MDIKGMIEEDLKKGRILSCSLNKLHEPKTCKSYGYMKGKEIEVNKPENQRLENRIAFKSIIAQK